MKPTKQYLLPDIVEQIRNPDSCWNGLLALKNVTSIENLDTYHHYCNDSFWVVRWAIIEKLGDFASIESLDILFEKLNDSDDHVKKTTQKAIHKCVKNHIEHILMRCTSSCPTTKHYCHMYLSKYALININKIEQFIYTASWLDANTLLHLLFNMFKNKIESTLIKATKQPFTQKNAIMMLAIIGSKRSVPHLISLYETPALKRHIIEALKMEEATPCYPVLLSYLDNDASASFIQDMIIKLGQPIAPTLIQYLSLTKYPERLVACLKHISIPLPMYRVLEKKVSESATLQTHINVSQLKPN